jgi:hypothetical protein
MPYYKWKFKALRDLYWPRILKVKSELNKIEGIEDDDYHEISFEEKMVSLLNVSDERIFTGKVENDIDLIAGAFIEKLKQDGLIENVRVKDGNFLEPYAYEVNNHIKDVSIRNMHILAAV